MLKNSIAKSELQKRINLQDENTSKMVKLIQMFFMAVLSDYKTKNNLSFQDVPKISPFVSYVLDFITKNSDKIIPKVFTQFFQSKKADFKELSFETGTKCIHCDKESALEIEKSENTDTLKPEKGKKKFFCNNCYTIFTSRVIQKVLSDASKVEEFLDEIEYYGSSVNASVDHAFNTFELEEEYKEDIFLFAKAACEYIFTEDDKAQKYFIKLFEELSDDDSVKDLIYLNPNYNYSYPNFQLYA